jgi:hypothetical protein
MAEILIEGGDAEAAAQAMCVAVREIFEVDPIRSSRGGSPPGTRGLADLAAVIAVGLPPAIFYGRRLVDDIQFAERWRRLFMRGKDAQKKTSARILIDDGDGNHVPIEDAHPDKIREALTALQEKHSKS